MIRAILSRACLTAAALTVVAGPAAAQTVDELVAKHIAARGGMDKLKAIQTLKITRTVGTGIGNNVKVIVYKKRPVLVSRRAGPGHGRRDDDVPRASTRRRLGHGAGQDRDAPPEPAEAETRDLDGDFDGLLVDWKEKGHTVTFAGREKMPGGEALKLKVTLKSGLRADRLPGCNHLSRSAAHRHPRPAERPQGSTSRSTIDNWRDVNGVKFPFDIIEDRTGKEPARHARHLHREDRDQRADGRRAVRGAGQVSGALNPRCDAVEALEDRRGRAIDVLFARSPVRDRDAHRRRASPHRPAAPAHADALDRGDHLVRHVRRQRARRSGRAPD